MSPIREYYSPNPEGNFPEFGFWDHAPILEYIKDSISFDKLDSHDTVTEKISGNSVVFIFSRKCGATAEEIAKHIYGKNYYPEIESIGNSKISVSLEIIIFIVDDIQNKLEECESYEELDALMSDILNSSKTFKSTWELKEFAESQPHNVANIIRGWILDFIPVPMFTTGAFKSMENSMASQNKLLGSLKYHLNKALVK